MLRSHQIPTITQPMKGDVMARKLTKSNAQFQRAVKRLPLGVASNFRYWGEERPIYVKKGVGARIVDLDGNSYVDYRLGYGPAILGYAHPEVDQAAREGMEVGGVFALSTEREFTVAERISKMVPAAELVRFSNSGTEAVMAGLRLARAYTGKDDYVILEGGYHGLFDAAMWFTPMDKWSQVGDPEVKPYSEGVPISTRSFAHFVQANDANQLEDVSKRHAHRIACMLIEPIMGNCLGIAAEPEYLRAARELCDKHGVVLLIDEVKTGFRGARRSAGALRHPCRSLHIRQGTRQRLSHLGAGRARTHHAQDRPRRRAWGNLYGAFGLPGGCGPHAADSRRNRCARAHRRLRHEAARRHALHPLGPRRRAQFRRPSLHERTVFRSRAAEKLSRMEGERLLLLRRDGPGAAR